MKWRIRFVVYALILTALLASSNGCCVLLGAGLAGAAGTGYVYCKNKTCETFSVNLEEAWFATHRSLAELGLPVLAEQPDQGIIETQTASGKKVRISVTAEEDVIPADGEQTRVCVRIVGLGGILQQIAANMSAERSLLAH